MSLNPQELTDIVNEALSHKLIALNHMEQLAKELEQSIAAFTESAVDAVLNFAPKLRAISQP